MNHLDFKIEKRQSNNNTLQRKRGSKLNLNSSKLLSLKGYSDNYWKVSEHLRMVFIQKFFFINNKQV